jgi:hypothetical protein
MSASSKDNNSFSSLNLIQILSKNISEAINVGGGETAEDKELNRELIRAKLREAAANEKAALAKEEY